MFQGDLPFEAVAARLSGLGIRNPQRLHLVSNRESASVAGRTDAEILHRLVLGLITERKSPLILDAWIEGSDLLLLSPEFERLRVPLRVLSKWIGTDETRARAFEIDEDGSFLYWPHADAHFGWEQFEQLVDPAKALAAQQKSAEFNRRYGAAIRRFREEKGLKQSEIPGLSSRQLRRVEHGDLRASKATLDVLARAHGISLKDYLQALSKRLDRPPRS